MKVAVVSDIHSNRQAFEAVLEAVADSDASELWCLGDIVGYGADPDACVELARRHVAVCLAGNHDMAVVGELPLDEFSRGASIAAQWTREVIAPRKPVVPRRSAPPGPRGHAGWCDRALSRKSARPGVGVRALGVAGGAVSGPRAQPHLPDRPLPRRLVVHASGRGGGDRRTVSRGHRARPRQAANGCSIPAASGSHATATAERRGCCWTWTGTKLPTDAPPMTWPAPPRPSRQRVCQTRSRSAWSTVSEHANRSSASSWWRCSAPPPPCWCPAEAPARA